MFFDGRETLQVALPGFSSLLKIIVATAATITAVCLHLEGI